MRSVVSRRAVVVAGAAAMAVVALTGCSAGQVAETALKRPSNQGVNANNSDNSVVIRNLAVAYNGPAGYPAGANAPLELGLYNQTTQEIQVLVSSQPPAPPTAAASPDDGTSVVYGTNVGLIGPAPAASEGGTPAPSGSGTPSETPSPAQPAAQPARITLAPLGSATFRPGDKETLQVMGLSGKLIPGQSVSLTFTFNNQAEPLTVRASTSIALSPGSRAPGVEGENSEE